MMFLGINSDKYTIGRELGKGGEGTVYELKSHTDHVLKLYNERLTDDKIAKLQLMAAMRDNDIERYAAWPIDVARDEHGMTRGFVMRKLSGYMPLHMVFSPMDRKKLFPDKGYNFLAHVARNLATAFHKLHEAGLVVGDVNEGNILINANGFVAFIDCDSFQVKGPGGYFFCEVGIPRYTPPELLKERTFENVVRTVNTDGFSMAILIFQLLFLGRHPFAGRNRSSADMDEETAIRKREFAYSLDNTRKKLLPPPDSFNIADLPTPLARLFHVAFEQDARPLPAEWIKELDALLTNLATCAVSRLHAYPGAMKECPWCRFRNTRGILYFIDDSYLRTDTSLGDVENFVNGFQVDALELPKWDTPLTRTSLTANPVEKKYRAYKALNQLFMLLSLVVCVVAFRLSGHKYPLLITCGCALPLFLYKFSPLVSVLKRGLKEKTTAYRKVKDDLDRLVLEYDAPPDGVNYSARLGKLTRYVKDFQQLPAEMDRRKKIMEEEVYNEQLGHFLVLFDIASRSIPSFGDAKKALLYDHGIRTAADINKLNHTKVPGIGPKNTQVLLSWQRQIAADFVYIPDSGRMAAGITRVNNEITQVQARLEHLIREEYRSLTHLKQNIANRRMVLKSHIMALSVRAYQAELDRNAFQRFINIPYRFS